MKKFNFRNIRIRKVSVDELDDQMLLINLYMTQSLIFIIGFVWVLFQRQSIIKLFSFQKSLEWIYFGVGLAGIIIAFDLIVSRFAPEDATDDGGVNERMFGKRPIWHIIVISLIVAICEELLFRGAIQYAIGPYWTSIVFAVIHIRYLKHWIPTGIVFLSSYGLGLIYEHTGTIWSAILAHFLIDLVMGLIIRFRRKS